MNILIFIALVCFIGAGAYSHNPWLLIPAAVGLIGWIVVGGS